MKKEFFKKRLDQIPNNIWNKITKIDEIKGQWTTNAMLSPQALSRLKRSVLVTSTGSSTRIEGAHLSDSEIEKLMKGIAIQKFSDRDKQEVQGYFELLQNIFNSFDTIAISENSIKHLHKELLKYVTKDAGHLGNYKKMENKVQMIREDGKILATLFNPTPPYLTQKEMQELVEWTRKSIKEELYHPLIIVGNFVIEFLKIHPFQDGNGRLSRVLTNLLMLQLGYNYVPYVSHEKLIESSKSKYYLALRKSQNTFKTKKQNITYWLEFFMEVLLNQARYAIKIISKENIESVLSNKQLLVWECLQKSFEITPKQIFEQTQIARPTINQALEKLIQLKKIKRLGLGRATRYQKND